MIVSCRRCGAVPRVDARFCDRCGQPLLIDAGADTLGPLEGEHKPASALFTDVIRSMDLQESLGPERWQSLMDRFLTVTYDVVAPLEGTVNEFTGDGWLVLFGVPVAHEDHARRACLAALALQRRFVELSAELGGGARFAVRCGIHAGPVIAGSIGAGLRREYTALGHAVSLAKRIEALAPPGSISISDSVVALVAGQFELRDLGLFEIKGASAPHRVYELLGPGAARNRLEAAAPQGLSRFVGRTSETDSLGEALDRAMAGDGQVVAIVAEAGIGKSRLCREFVHSRVDRRTAVLAVNVPSHGREIPLALVLELLRAFFGIDPLDDPEISRERVTAALLALDRELEEDVQLVLDFLGLGDPAAPLPRMDPDVRTQRMFAMSRKLIRGRSQREPAVVLIEDLQWIDAGSAAFLKELIAAWTRTRTLVLATFRPEFEPPWLSDASCRELRLAPLAGDAVEQMLSELLGAHPSCGRLRQIIEDRAAGNPFFVEELVRMLVDGGSLAGAPGDYRLIRPIDEIELPPTVQAVLLARIDRLNLRERTLLQTASVIGAKVSDAVLREVVDDDADPSAALRALVASGFLLDEGAEGEASLLFSHPLIREAAYASLLTERRARAHAATATAIERLYSGQLGEQAALLAHHYEGAQQALLAAQWHVRAAAWASATTPDEATSHWRRVVDLIEPLEESAETSRLGVAARTGILGAAWRHGLPAEEADAAYTEGHRLLRLTRDPSAATLLEAAYARNLLFTARIPEGLNIALSVLRRAEESRNGALTINVAGSLSYFLWATGRLDDVIEVTERAFEMTGGEDLAGGGMMFACPVAQCEFARTLAFADLGRLDDACASRMRAITLAHDHGDPQVEAYTLGIPIMMALELISFETLARAADLGVQVAERMGGGFALCTALLGRAVCSNVRRDWVTAEADAMRSLEISAERNAGLHFQPAILRTLVYARVGLGRTSLAMTDARKAIEQAQRWGLRTLEIAAQEMFARVLWAHHGPGAVTEIELALDRALSLAHEIGAEAWQPVIQLTRDTLMRSSGQQPRAGGREDALRRLAELGSCPLLPLPGAPRGQPHAHSHASVG